MKLIRAGTPALWLIGLTWPALVGPGAMQDGWARAWPGRKFGVPSGTRAAASDAADARWAARLAGRGTAAAGAACAARWCGPV